MNQQCFYGVVNQVQIHQYARAVCDALGHGVTNQGMNMLLRTVAQETGFATIRDKSAFDVGVGLCQFDEVAFLDVKARTRKRDIKVIHDQFDVDFDRVQHSDLAFSPLLSLIWCRLFYKLIPEEFPRELTGQAQYWKKHYNTESGKGTITKFVTNSIRYGVG